MQVYVNQCSRVFYRVLLWGWCLKNFIFLLTAICCLPAWSSKETVWSGGIALPVIELTSVQKHLVDTSLTVSSSTVTPDLFRDFSVACDQLAQAGLCISLLGQGIAECNWQELMNCRLSFSVCAASILPKTSRKLQKSQFRTAFRAEKFVAARRKCRQEVLRLWQFLPYGSWNSTVSTCITKNPSQPWPLKNCRVSVCRAIKVQFIFRKHCRKRWTAFLLQKIVN